MAYRRVGLVEFESERADRAAVRALRDDQRVAIARQQREDLLDRVGCPLPRGLEQHLVNPGVVAAEYGDGDRLLRVTSCLQWFR